MISVWGDMWAYKFMTVDTGRCYIQAPPPKEHNAVIRDANIKKIRVDPLFLGGSDTSPADTYTSYLAQVLCVDQEEIRGMYTTKQLQQVRQESIFSFSLRG